MEEKKNIRTAWLFGFLSIVVVVLLAIYGVPVASRVATFFSGLKKSPASKEQSVTALAPPFLETVPDAVNKSPLEITGNVESGNSVVINLNGAETELVTETSGAFSTKLTLKKGDNSLFAYTKNSAGAKSKNTQTYTILFDNEAPKIDISSPSDGASFYGSKQQTVTIKGITKAESSLTLNDRFVSVNDDGSFSASYSLNEGENNLTLKVVDQAGNETTSSLKLNYSP